MYQITLISERATQSYLGAVKIIFKYVLYKTQQVKYIVNKRYGMSVIYYHVANKVLCVKSILLRKAVC